MASPSMGNADRREALQDKTTAQPEVLGSISTNNPLIDPRLAGTTSQWTNPEGEVITLNEPPPPWEIADNSYSLSDARRFVDCPPNFKLRWLNPRLLDSEGWRDWQALMASDNRVSVKVPTMVSPEGYIRRGGSGGDILCWMWNSWYESKKQQHIQLTNLQTQKAVEHQDTLREEFKRGTYGRNVTLEGAKHPTHTMAEGKSLRDN
jgi:hypothetical protein